ncbi:MAG: hypothetical protein WDN76_00940 [Alphaproteobacteria bacterium]
MLHAYVAALWHDACELLPLIEHVPCVVHWLLVVYAPLPDAARVKHTRSGRSSGYCCLKCCTFPSWRFDNSIA